MIVSRVAFYGIVYKGMHLLEVPVTGNARGSIHQPTKGGCTPFLDESCTHSDFTKLSELPYCKQWDLIDHTGHDHNHHGTKEGELSDEAHIHVNKVLKGEVEGEK